MNIVKQTLIEKKEVIQDQITELSRIKQDFIETRATYLLGKALEFLPDAKVKGQYDSFYIYPSSDIRNELISINQRAYGTNYLNTYSTFISNEYELQRLIVNGKIAELFLNDSELYDKLFAPTEYDSKLNDLSSELRLLQREIEKIEQEEAVVFRQEKLTKFFNGEEIEFEEPTIISYGAKKYDCIYRVIKFKCLGFNSSKKKATVEFTCKPWGEETPYKVLTYEGVAVKYLEYYI